MKLSKTNYLVYRDCAHNAWVKVHKPEVYRAKPISVFDQAIIEVGNDVDVRARDLFWLYLSNFVAILLTLGLFKPFADIRLARYRLEHLALHPQTSLDDISASQSQVTTATGEESADLFDFDISF